MESTREAALAADPGMPAVAPRRVALVTGSSRGIGLATARALAEAGYDVALNCSSERGLEALAAEAQALEERCGVRAVALAADVADRAQADLLVARASEALGPVDVLVNNAGITRDGLVARMAEEDFDAVLDVSLKGAFHCCRAVARPMMRRRWGRIINMSSIVGVRGNAGQANYAAAKAGIIGLTKALARELAPRGITVNAVAPGFINTAMTAALTDAQRQAMLERIGSGRLGEPGDVAALVRFLAGEEAGYITGQVIEVDGGMSL